MSHFRVDGAAQFRGILFIPKRAPFDMWDAQKKKTGIKLMVKKVYVMFVCCMCARLLYSNLRRRAAVLLTKIL